MLKLGKDLTTGDVFHTGNSRFVFIRANGPDIRGDGVSCVEVGRTKMETLYLREGLSYAIDARELVLTPAQQHADELVALIQRAKPHSQPKGSAGSWDCDAAALLDKIDPPRPVSVKTVLSLLRSARGAQVITGGLSDAIDETLDRARRAGQI